jgi:hypothetical protein
LQFIFPGTLLGFSCRNDNLVFVSLCNYSVNIPLTPSVCVMDNVSSRFSSSFCHPKYEAVCPGFSCQLLELLCSFKVCNSVHRHTIQINHQQDARVSPVYYLDVYLQLNRFGRPYAHHQEFNNCSSNL